MSQHVSAIANPATAAHTTQSTRARKSSSGASFAEVHAAAVRTARDQDSKSESASKTKGSPRGERTEKVEGHNYAEIVAGPRNGMFINTSDNERSGDAFVMVKRDGRQFHIYGTGDDRMVFEVGRAHASSKGTTGASGRTGTPATT